MAIGDDLARQMLEGADRALLEAAHAVGVAARANMPVGDPSEDPDPAVSLRDNINISVLPGGHSIRVSVDTPYAAKQHEDLHAKHPRGGGPKFLERALLEIAPRLDNIVAGQVRAQTARGNVFPVKTTRLPG